MLTHCASRDQFLVLGKAQSKLNLAGFQILGRWQDPDSWIVVQACIFHHWGLLEGLPPSLSMFCPSVKWESWPRSVSPNSVICKGITFIIFAVSHGSFIFTHYPAVDSLVKQMFLKRTLCVSHYHNGKAVSLGKSKVTINKAKTVLLNPSWCSCLFSAGGLLFWLKGKLARDGEVFKASYRHNEPFFLTYSEGLRKNWKKNKVFSVMQRH